MKRFHVKLGNVEQRRGHRHDCAQCEVTITVAAHDEAHAVEVVRELALRVVTAAPADGLGAAAVTVDINPETISAKTCRVWEAK